MEFSNLVDLIQVFANEYCKPSFIILIYVTIPFTFEDTLRNLFRFITSEVIIISDSPSEHVDITVGNILPFESHSFDLIISFQGISKELKRVLKPNGKLLIKNTRNEANFVNFDALETYKIARSEAIACAFDYFSVL